MQRQALYDIANAPTAPLTEALIEREREREHNRIATLGRNQIIYDHHRKYALTGGERVTRVLPRPKPSLWRSVINLFTRKQKGRAK